MSDSVKTSKGTTLPLLNLKGKPYLQVAHRIQWLNEETPKFTIETQFPIVNDDQTLCIAKVTVLDKEGNLLRSSTATKRETKKDFGDHTEKAETGAIGRALALLGFGTQFALADLDEGDRLADSPVVDTRKLNTKTTAATAAPKQETTPAPVASVAAVAPKAATPAEAPKKSSFRSAATSAPVANVATKSFGTVKNSW